LFGAESNVAIRALKALAACVLLPLRVLLFVLSMALLAAVCKLVMLVCGARAPLKPEDPPMDARVSRVLRLLVRGWCRLGLVLFGFYRVRVQGREQGLRALTAASNIIVGNHLSFIEGMAVIAHTGCSVVGKIEASAPVCLGAALNDASCRSLAIR
jgi:1-acyl-sn-glycerol-3-phosphate acyltransferase